MKEHPILFSTPMVQAILEGRKTMTRRIAKVPNYDHYGTNIMDWGLSEHPYFKGGKWYYTIQSDVDDSSTNELKCPYGQIGDRLWVRETFQYVSIPKEYKGFVYKASGGLDWEMSNDEWKWKPSIFMPRKASRISLEITNIKVERLHDISEEDAKLEGVLLHKSGRHYLDYMKQRAKLTQFIYSADTAKESFKTLWTLINGFRDEPFAWFKNPWVWVVEFKKIKP